MISVKKFFMRLQPENIQQILKAQNFNSLNELGKYTNRFHSQIVAQYFDQNRTTTSEFKYLADKVDELSTELCNVKKQSQFQKPHNSSYYDKCQSKANRTFFTSDAQCIVSMLLILHQNQTELFRKTDFVSITLSLVIAPLNVKVLAPFALLKITL